MLVAQSRVRKSSRGEIAVTAIVLADDPANSGAHVELISENGLSGDVRSESYPVKYMTFAGIAINNVGDNPRHNEVAPSYLAIFTNPSHVPLILRLLVSSIRHASAKLDDGDGDAENPDAGDEEAMQNSALLLIQKTSLQHAVTTSSGGILVNVDWNCSGDSGNLCARSGAEEALMDALIDAGVTVSGVGPTEPC